MALCRCVVFLALVACCGAGGARAQGVLPDEMPPVDAAAIASLQGENASISSAPLTDRYYTNGLQLGWVSPTDYLPAIAGLGRAVFGEGRQRVAIDISQQIYTPASTQVAVPPKGDERYAGLLLARFSQITDTARARGTLAFTIGIVGPSALGEETQNGFHGLIGQRRNAGWASQLHDEPVFAVDGSQVWRLPMGSVGGFETDVLPGLGLTLGTLRVAVEAGVNFRVGHGLQNDYGAPRVRGLGGGAAFLRSDELGYYVFAGFGGQAVARDEVLQGTIWNHPGGGVTTTPFVGQAQIGLAVLYGGARLTYAQVFQTQDFKHQHGGLHQLGALALAFRF